MKYLLTSLLASTALLSACSSPAQDKETRGTSAPLSALQSVANTPPPRGAMVVAANPLASEAGAKVLRDGGSAVDAAIAVQAVLGLVEPQSSGLGGGAFLVIYDPKTAKVWNYNGRETAPSEICLLYTSPSPRDATLSRMPSSA